jgi:CrcB protein
MDVRRAVAIASGGVVGAGVRWSVAETIDEPGSWPWAVFVVNLVGSAILGALVGRYGSFAGTTSFAALAVGFCGALTTFSAFAVDVAVFFDEQDWTLAVGYLAASLVAGLAAFAGARQAGRAVALGAAT